MKSAKARAAKRQAVIVHSEPVQSHIWEQISAYMPAGLRSGTLYHWVADPDEGVAWQVLELPDGSTITGVSGRTPKELEQLETAPDGSIRYVAEGVRLKILAVLRGAP